MKDEKEKLIETIIESVDFDCAKKVFYLMDVEGLGEGDSLRCSTEQWVRLLELHNVTAYSVAKEAVLMNQGEENNNCTIDSVKAEIYDIGKSRKPSLKHTLALKNVILENSSLIKNVGGLRFSYKFNKVLALSNVLSSYLSNDIIVISKEVARELLEKMCMTVLVDIHNQFTTIGWHDYIAEDNDVDYINSWLTRIRDCNLVFMNNNFDVLYKHFDKIEFIIDALAIYDENILIDKNKVLSKKRMFGRDSACYSDLSSLLYDEDVKLSEKKDVISSIENKLNEYPEFLPLIFGISKLTSLKWNTLLLLVRHYEKNPNGKRVRDWLEM